MYRTTSGDQPQKIDVESVSNSDQEERRHLASAAFLQGRDRSFGDSNLSAQVRLQDVSRIADQGDAFANGLPKCDPVFVREVSDGVACCSKRHCLHRGHVTAGTLAEQARRGSGLPFCSRNTHLSKGTAA